ncbi:MAG TPA: carboxypeptidase regulatory-like domain-containing protein [Longimicrobiales bacterium]
MEITAGAESVEVIRVPGMDDILTGSDRIDREIPLEPGREQGGRIVGRVIETDTDQPIAGAVVRLPELERTGLTDGDGRFVFADVPPGSFALEVSHIAYDTARGTVPMSDDDVVEVLVRLGGHAIALDSILVTTHRRGVLAGFYQRMEEGVGTFITREQIERRSQRTLTELLGQAGVRVGAGYLYVRRWGCPPMVYLDGVPLTRPALSRHPMREARDAIELVDPADVEGIEVYHGASQAPGIYARRNAACGVIGIWTRRGTGVSR